LKFTSIINIENAFLRKCFILFHPIASNNHLLRFVDPCYLHEASLIQSEQPRLSGLVDLKCSQVLVHLSLNAGGSRVISHLPLLSQSLLLFQQAHRLIPSLVKFLTTIITPCPL